MNAKTHIGLSGGAAVLIVALGWVANAGGYAADVQAAPDAPVSSSPVPPPPPTAPPAMTQSPNQDYWTGQGGAGGAPGAGAGGAGGGGGGGGGG